MMLISLKCCRWYDVYAATTKGLWWEDEVVMSQYADARCRRWCWCCRTESPEDETLCDTV